MKIAKLIVLLFTALGLLSCGGGGGGGAAGITLTGRVLSIVTGGSLNPAVIVQSTTGATATTSIIDGSFSVSSPSGSTSLLVNSAALGVFTFTFPTATQATTDIGDLWVGPEKVTVVGTLQNAASGLGISGGKVQFGGQNAVTDSTGQFAIANVAYSSTSTAGFLGLVGNAAATGFFPNTFTSSGNTAVSGLVDVGIVLLTPLSDSTPPGSPYTIWGKVSPAANALGTIVTLKQSGSAIRQFNVGLDGKYQFWVPVGTYTIEYKNGSLTAPTQTVTLTLPTDVIQKDVSLN